MQHSASWLQCGFETNPQEEQMEMHKSPEPPPCVNSAATASPPSVMSTSASSSPLMCSRSQKTTPLLCARNYIQAPTTAASMANLSSSGHSMLQGGIASSVSTPRVDAYSTHSCVMANAPVLTPRLSHSMILEPASCPVVLQSSKSAADAVNNLPTSPGVETSVCYEQVGRCPNTVAAGCQVVHLVSTSSASLHAPAGPSACLTQRLSDQRHASFANVSSVGSSPRPTGGGEASTVNDFVHSGSVGTSRPQATQSKGSHWRCNGVDGRSLRAANGSTSKHQRIPVRTPSAPELCAEEYLVGEGTLMALDSDNLKLEKEKFLKSQDQERKWLKHAIHRHARLWKEEEERQRVLEERIRKKCEKAEALRSEKLRLMQLRRDMKDESQRAREAVKSQILKQKVASTLNSTALRKECDQRMKAKCFSPEIVDIPDVTQAYLSLNCG